ncbi:MAG: penicillin-binding protein 2, partial [Acidimicrobiia bacterium]|nr:penicillin-binding protein 2 [Acidimicrobiia bacterium]
MSEEAPAIRLAAVGIVVLSLFAALFARLYYLQILDPKTVEEVRGGQLLRTVPFQAPRGRILDRTGAVIVDNRQAITITIDRRAFDELEPAAQTDLVGRLASTMNEFGVPTKVGDIEARMASPRYDPLKPVPIAEDVSPELELYLLERSRQFPAVDAERTWMRVYPAGDVAAHVIGYVGDVNESELEERRAATKPYEPGDEIGKAGVERTFEDDLRGVPGRRVIEVDARNVEIDQRAVLPAQPGDDVQLTLDLALQGDVEILLAQALEEARGQKKRNPTDPDYNAPAGAVVVLDARNGDVLSLASHPTYAPSDFVGGISESRFAQLNDEASHAPLTDRAISGGYAPGSTFKPFTAHAALINGLIAGDTVVSDRGSYEIAQCLENGGAGCVFSNAGGAVNGDVDLARALEVSSDVYFYRLGDQFWDARQRLGPTPIQSSAELFGFGTLSGIELPNEYEGLIDTPERRGARHEENPEAFPNGEWFTGDNVNLAIGQGDLLVTPLQLANSYAAWGNGGKLLRPRVVRQIVDRETGGARRVIEPQVLRQIELPPGLYDPIVTGLRDVVGEPLGTAADAFAGFPLGAFPVAGKTGTVEVGPTPKGEPRADTAIFASFAPADDPRYVVVALLEEAGFGAEAAVPLVRRIYERLPEVEAIIGPAPPLTPGSVPADPRSPAGPPASPPPYH